AAGSAIPQGRPLSGACGCPSRRQQMPKPRVHHTFLLLPVLAACGASAPTPEGVVTYDSAGIQVVHSARPVWTVADRGELARAPTVTIGQREGLPEQLLYQVRAAVRLDDGRIVI